LILRSPPPLPKRSVAGVIDDRSSPRFVIAFILRGASGVPLGRPPGSAQQKR
jgi:hypothetical protein